MQIILTQNVPHLGVVGDEVLVKPGYARNYLLPQGKAVLATNKESKKLRHQIYQLQKLRAEALENAEAQAEILQKENLCMVRKAGNSGRLFGSVTNRDIESLLKEKGYEIERRSIVLFEPIKTVGTHSIAVKLHTDLKIEVEIKVTPEGEIEEPVVEEVVVEEVVSSTEDDPALEA